ncbi:MAG: hypothetical protein KC621_21065 [Myxococcales bacterium]|nr:hypothetical protein [Myxococcales bacterium]
MLLLSFAAAAHAQDVRFDGQLFRPSADATRTLWVEDTHAAPDGYGTARAYVQGALAPVRWTGEDGQTDRLVSGLVGTDVLGAFSWGGLRLGAHLPVYAWTGGALDADQPGLGDLALDLKGHLIDRDRAPVGLSLMGRLMLPTASVEVPLGSSGIGWELTAVVDQEVDRFLVAANLGTRGLPRATFQDMVWDDQVFGRIGAGYAFLDGAGASLELAAQTNWASGRNPAGTAAELMGGGFGRVREDVLLRGGVSVGLSRSPGAPIGRLVVGASFEPDAYPDRDADGIVDRDDWCPDEPEDPDGFEDADGCLDRSTTARLALVAPDGSPVEGVIELDGPERVTLAPGDEVVTLHPGTYHATVTASGFETWSGDLDLGFDQARTIQVPLLPHAGSVSVWAVDPDGEPVVATVSVSGAPSVAADGNPIEVLAGEHGLVITAPGFAAVATSVDVGFGESRELPVVLVPSASDDEAPEPPVSPDTRVGSR